MSLKTTIAINLTAIVSQANDTGPASAQHTTGLLTQNWLDGVGFNQADLAFSDIRSLAASANEDLDLVGGFTDGLGNTVSPAKVAAIAFLNYSTTQTLRLKPASSNGWTGLQSGSTDYLSIPPASTDMPGCVIFCAPRGLTITAGTGDLVNVANPSGSTASYRIVLIGRST